MLPDAEKTWLALHNHPEQKRLSALLYKINILSTFLHNLGWPQMPFFCFSRLMQKTISIYTVADGPVYHLAHDLHTLALAEHQSAGTPNLLAADILTYSNKAMQLESELEEQRASWWRLHENEPATYKNKVPNTDNGGSNHERQAGVTGLYQVLFADFMAGHMDFNCFARIIHTARHLTDEKDGRLDDIAQELHTLVEGTEDDPDVLAEINIGSTNKNNTYLSVAQAMPQLKRYHTEIEAL